MLTLLQCIDRLDLVLLVMADAELMKLILQNRAYDVLGVLQAVDSTNFVTVISRDGNLDDAQPGRVKLGDDLRVEMKIVSVSMEGHLLDRKSTRLNSSHVKISYAVLCLQKHT